MEQVIAVETPEIELHAEEATQELSELKLALVGGGGGIMLFI